jgi:hypothetical protein
MEILTGMPAGEADEEGNFPENSINFLVQRRLLELDQDSSKTEKEDKKEKKPDQPKTEDPDG